MTSSSLSTLLHLHGLPPLPRSLTGYVPQGQGLPPYYGPSLTPHLRSELMPSAKNAHVHAHGRPSPPVPPPRPHSRRSSSSGSSFRASPEHISNRSVIVEPMRNSPRSLSSSPHSPHIDSGLGRSSADSFSEPRAFVRVVKSPVGVGTKLDAQLAQLKKDMHHLRQQDMALLGHLLQIHQGIQDLKNVLVPPPQPAPSSGPIPMFHSTPAYPSQHSYSSSSSSSRNGRKHHSNSSYSQQQQSTSRLSILTGSKLFSRRSSAEKMMVESLNMGMDLGACGGSHSHSHSRASRNRDDESDSVSSLEFGDV